MKDGEDKEEVLSQEILDKLSQKFLKEVWNSEVAMMESILNLDGSLGLKTRLTMAPSKLTDLLKRLSVYQNESDYYLETVFEFLEMVLDSIYVPKK
ncbi:unnamed protein product [Kuraishia capsulata CBS 1993]|uniref:Uncharacterized protein n=1 Tax=Kuraishia capsulata CBS 1993 TaxID=1382522 RepID=W6MIQ7_9ASCO|nr:uncharacterized protein KUCA_T00001997001 [Kuraishia capsulata CBS 1993]CDK26026.1 unnamed protein product [Kuraishia capsulata CBS 1993]